MNHRRVFIHSKISEKLQQSDLPLDYMQIKKLHKPSKIAYLDNMFGVVGIGRVSTRVYNIFVYFLATESLVLSQSECNSFIRLHRVCRRFVIVHKFTIFIYIIHISMSCQIEKSP